MDKMSLSDNCCAIRSPERDHSRIEAFKVPLYRVRRILLTGSRLVSTYIQGRFRRNCSLSRARTIYILYTVLTLK